MISKPLSLACVAGLVGLGFAFLDAPAHAQQSELDVLRQQIAEMQAKLQQLEDAQKKVADTAKTAPAVTTKSPVVISGLLQVQSLNYPSENIQNNGESSRDTFRLRRGELRVNAPSITNKISGMLMIDPAKTATNRNANNGTASSVIRLRDNILQEIQLSYAISKNPKRGLILDAGQFKIPVGFESLQGSSALPFTERALIFTQRDPFDGGYGDVRDTGIQLRANFPEIEARLGVFNGIGDRQNGLALSDHKAILGWLAYKPKSVAGLQIGISGGQGNTGVEGVQTVNGANIAITPRDHRKIFNAFAAYKKDKFSAQGEYLTGDATPIQVNNGMLAGRNIKGYYGSVGYFFTPKIEGVARYDYVDTNRDRADSDVTDYLLGVNYYFKGNNAKLQTNLVKRNGGANAATNLNPASNLRNDRYELRTSFQIAF